MAETKTMTPGENVTGDFQRLIDFFTTPVNLAPTREETMRAAPAAPAEGPAPLRPGFGRAVVGLGAKPAAAEVPMQVAPPPGAGREAFGRIPEFMMRPGSAPALSFSPVEEFSPAQQRVQAMAAALQGVPAPVFAEFMGALPKRGTPPEAREQASQTYLDRALGKYLQAEQQGFAYAEDAQAAENELMQSLLKLIDPNMMLMPEAQ